MIKCSVDFTDNLRSVPKHLTNMSYCTLMSRHLYPTHTPALFLDNAVIVKGIKDIRSDHEYTECKFINNNKMRIKINNNNVCQQIKSHFTLLTI